MVLSFLTFRTVGFLFRWSVFLPKAIGRAWRANDGARLASVWFAVVFVFFSISKTQLVLHLSVVLGGGVCSG